MAAMYVLDHSGPDFVFTLVAPNGESILSSDHYPAKDGALDGIRSVRTYAPLSSRYERRMSREHAPYFVLKDLWGEVIGTSETFESEEARDEAIEAAQSVATYAELVDRS